MSVNYNEESKIFTLKTKTFSYSMIISSEARIITLYYGTKLVEIYIPDIKIVI